MAEPERGEPPKAAWECEGAQGNGADGQLGLRDISDLRNNLKLDTEHLQQVCSSSEQMLKHHEQEMSLLRTCIWHNKWLLGQLESFPPQSGPSPDASPSGGPKSFEDQVGKMPSYAAFCTADYLDDADAVLRDSATESLVDPSTPPGMLPDLSAHDGRKQSIKSGTPVGGESKIKTRSFGTAHMPDTARGSATTVTSASSFESRPTTSRVTRKSVIADAEDTHKRDRAWKMSTIRKSQFQARHISELPPPPPPTRWQSFRTKTREVVEHLYFEFLLSAVVITNLIFVAIQVDDSVQNPNDTPLALYIVEYLYTIIFVVELAMRVIAEGTRFVFGPTHMWNAIDSIIVLFSMVEVGLDMYNWTYAEDEGSGSNISYLRIIRVARTLRVIRVAKFMRFVRALRVLIYSILSTLKSLVWTLLLLALIIYAFGIIFTSGSAEHLLNIKADPTYIPTENSEALLENFGSIPRSLFTLFKAVTGGLDWHYVVKPLSDVGWFMVLLFLVYIAFTCFAVLNVVTGVFCQSAMESASSDREMLCQAQIASKQDYIVRAQELFKDIDDDNIGVLTLAEFERCVQDESMQSYFTFLDLDIPDAWSLFKLIDVNEACEISMEEFVLGCIRLKGPAKSIDFAMMMYQNEKILKKLGKLQGNEEPAALRSSAASAFEWGRDSQRSGTDGGFVTAINVP